MEKLSVAIITFNEAENITRCLDSVALIADDIVVVDSHSTDATAQIARDKGARVILHPFQDFVRQKQFAIDQARHEKVLLLDADEWLSTELREEIAAVKKEWRFDCYLLNRLNGINSRWIRHGSWYPDYLIRLFDRKKVQVTGRKVHERIEGLAGATTSRLKAHLYHLTDRDITDRYRALNRFSLLAAQALLEEGKKPSLFRLIFKPPARFIVEYFFRRGFLDGFYGFVIARSAAHYVHLREAKLMELYHTNLRQNR